MLVLFERLAFNFLWGLVEALKSGKLHFWKGNVLLRKRRRWAYSLFHVVLQALGSHQNPRCLAEENAFFYNAKQR